MTVRAVIVVKSGCKESFLAQDHMLVPALIFPTKATGGGFLPKPIQTGSVSLPPTNIELVPSCAAIADAT